MKNKSCWNEIKSFYVFGRTYYVNKNGDVFNEHGRLMTKEYGREYPYVEFRHIENGKIIRKRYFCHRLVAQMFLPNPNGLSQINHIDGDKNNCHISNLEWVTPSENQVHSRYILGNTTGFRDVLVECIETHKIYASTRAAWRDTGARFSHISECALGKRKTAGGYHWRYV